MMLSLQQAAMKIASDALKKHQRHIV